MGKTELKDGMDRMLGYHECLVEDKELKNMCDSCEKYLYEQHDYNVRLS